MQTEMHMEGRRRGPRRRHPLRDKETRDRAERGSAVRGSGRPLAGTVSEVLLTKRTPSPDRPRGSRSFPIQNDQDAELAAADAAIGPRTQHCSSISTISLIVVRP